MLTSWHLYMRKAEVCIKARPPPASVAVIGQVTKHTTVKWPNLVTNSFQLCLQNYPRRNKSGVFTITVIYFLLLRLGRINYSNDQIGNERKTLGVVAATLIFFV